MQLFTYSPTPDSLILRTAQAHDLEEGRKQSERRTRELRSHVESLNREFERIQGSVTPGGRSVDWDGDRRGTPRKNAADTRSDRETSVEDQLLIIRTQLDDTERRFAFIIDSRHVSYYAALKPSKMIFL